MGLCPGRVWVNPKSALLARFRAQSLYVALLTSSQARLAGFNCRHLGLTCKCERFFKKQGPGHYRLHFFPVLSTIDYKKKLDYVVKDITVKLHKSRVHSYTDLEI